MSEPHDTAVRLDMCLRQTRSLGARLAVAREAVEGVLVFTTSFGLEDQAIVRAIAARKLAVDIVTLDTGRLFPETYAVWSQTEERYAIRISAKVPASASVEALVARQGINGQRASVEARQACCEIRKVEPLRRALDNADGWITGLRAQQSHNRAETPLAAFDPLYGVIKLNPLADWSRDACAAYVAKHGVPYNRLHDRGFLSIGCAPCTRAVNPGEPERAGRWWWEADMKKECGLHRVSANAPAAGRAADALQPPAFGESTP